MRRHDRIVYGLYALVISGILLTAASLCGNDAKLASAEILARHLDSIGPAGARAAIKSRVAQGTGHLKVLVGGHADMTGSAVSASEGRKDMFAIDFNYKQYPREAAAFDGDKVHAPRVVAESRSPLGDFLNTYDWILRAGLLGGSLSTAWPLLSLEGRHADVKYAGLKKIEGRELHRFDYHDKGTGDMKVGLYFEPESFRHVMTAYELSAAAAIGSGPDSDQFSGHRSSRSAGQLPTRYRLQENFSDFRTVDGLTLPSHWTLQLTIEQGPRTSLWEWDLTFTKVTHNLEIDPKVFTLEQ
jgi:hypothetical protein